MKKQVARERQAGYWTPAYLGLIKIPSEELEEGAVMAYKQVVRAFGKNKNEEAQKALTQLYDKGALSEVLYLALAKLRTAVADSQPFVSASTSSSADSSTTISSSNKAASSSPILQVSDVEVVHYSLTSPEQEKSREGMLEVIKVTWDLYEKYPKGEFDVSAYVTIFNVETFLEQEREAYHVLRFDYHQGNFQLADMNDVVDSRVEQE